MNLGQQEPNQSEQQAALTQALAAFNTPPIQAAAVGAVNSSINKTNDNDSTIVASTGEISQPELGEGEGELTEETGDEQEQLTPEFTQQFEQTFGIKPEEAVTLFNELQSFRDEQKLMRTWGVNASEYDQRMDSVREFYKTLPDEGKEQFNTVEGANAIWEHLVNTQKVAKPTQTKAKQTQGRLKVPQAKKPETISKSAILKMTDAEYQKNLPAITRAFADGRVLMDA